jgi:hypothetical protein
LIAEITLVAIDQGNLLGHYSKSTALSAGFT